MNSNRKTAIAVGALFLIALFTDIISVSVFGNAELSKIVILLDFISGIAVASIGILMFSILKPHNKTLAKGYAVARITEGIIFIMGVLLLYFGIIKSTIYTDLIYVYIFSLGALMLYYVLYKSKIVPQVISIWGIIAIILLLIANSTGLLSSGSAMTVFFALPIALNEVVLSFWLILKGFNQKKLNTT